MFINQLVDQGKKGDHIVFRDYTSWSSGVIEHIDYDNGSVTIGSSDSRNKLPTTFDNKHPRILFIVPSHFFTERMREKDIEQLVLETTPYSYATRVSNHLLSTLKNLRRSYTTDYLSDGLQDLLLSKQKDNEVVEQLTDGYMGIGLFPDFSPEEIKALIEFKKKGNFPNKDPT